MGLQGLEHQALLPPPPAASPGPLPPHPTSRSSRSTGRRKRGSCSPVSPQLGLDRVGRLAQGWRGTHHAQRGPLAEPDGMLGQQEGRERTTQQGAWRGHDLSYSRQRPTHSPGRSLVCSRGSVKMRGAEREPWMRATAEQPNPLCPQALRAPLGPKRGMPERTLPTTGSPACSLPRPPRGASTGTPPQALKGRRWKKRE